jgi:hypothetical protein
MRTAGCVELCPNLETNQKTSVRTEHFAVWHIASFRCRAEFGRYGCPTGNPRMDTMRNLPVAPTCRMPLRLPRRANHPHLFGHPAASARGALRDRHERWLWDAMGAVLAIDDRRGRVRRSRVVLAPRRWR